MYPKEQKGNDMVIKSILNFLIDIKWYILSFIFGAIVLWFIVSGKSDSESIDKLFNWMVQKKGETIKQKIKNNKENIENYENKEKEIDKKIKDIRDDRKQINQKVKQKTIKNLSKDFKDLGY